MHWCPIPPSVWCSGHSFLCTCVSVRRRDRCTRIPPIHVFVTFVHCFVHAPFPCFLFGLLLALPWSSALCSAQILSVLLSVSLVVLWSLASVALRGSWDCVVFVLLLVRLAVLLVFVAFLAVLEWALLLLLLSALLCCVFFSPSSLPSLPCGLSRLVLWSSLYLGVLVPPSGYLVAAVTA